MDEFSEAKQLIDPTLEMVSPLAEVPVEDEVPAKDFLMMNNSSSSSENEIDLNHNPIKRKHYPGSTEKSDILEEAYCYFKELGISEFDLIVKANALDIMKGFRSFARYWYEKYCKYKETMEQESKQMEAYFKRLIVTKENYYQEEKAEIKREIRKKKDENIQLQNKNDNLNKQISKLNAELISKEGEYRQNVFVHKDKNNESSVMQLIETIKDLEKSIAKSENQLLHAKHEIENLSKAVNKWKKDFDDCKYENEKLQNAMIKMKDDIEASESRNDQLKKELKNALKDLKENDAEIQQMKLQHEKIVEDLQQQNNCILSEQQKTAAINSKLFEKCKNLDAEVVKSENKFKEKLALFKEENSKLQEELKLAERNAAKLTEEIATKNANLASVEACMNQKLISINNKNTVLEANLKLVEKEIQDMRYRSISLKSELEESRRRLDASKIEKQNLNDAIDKFEKIWIEIVGCENKEVGLELLEDDEELAENPDHEKDAAFESLNDVKKKFTNFLMQFKETLRKLEASEAEKQNLNEEIFGFEKNWIEIVESDTEANQAPEVEEDQSTEKSDHQTNAVLEGSNDVKKKLANFLTKFKESRTQITELQSTLAILKSEYEQNQSKLKDANNEVETARMEVVNVMAQLKLEKNQLQKSKFIMAKNNRQDLENFADQVNSAFRQKHKAELDELNALLQTERDEYQTKAATFLEAGAKHVEEEKTWINLLAANKNKIDSLEMEIVLLQKSLKFYNDIFNENDTRSNIKNNNGEVVPSKRKRKHQNPYDQQQQQQDFSNIFEAENTDTLNINNNDISFPNFNTNIQ